MAGVILLATSLTGCSAFQGLRDNLQYNDSMNDFVMGWRNSVWARQAWHEHKREFVHEPQYVSFGQGFRDGYASVAAGGSGCVPALPPRSFWTWKYQTGEGQAKVAAWYAGYPYGAKAAQEDGAGHYQQIQVSHLIEAQYSPEFRQGMCPGCDPSLIQEVLPDGMLPAGGPPNGLPTPATPGSPQQGFPPADQWPAEVPLPGAGAGGAPAPAVPAKLPPLDAETRFDRSVPDPSFANRFVQATTQVPGSWVR